MWRVRWVMLLAAAIAAGFAATGAWADGAQAITSARREAVAQSVRQFALSVAADVSREGPAAWRGHFLDSPAFFMAVNGRMQFADSQAATQGIQDVSRAIPRIELHWGEDLRVDVLTPEFAMVASTFHEVLTDREGHEDRESGFFTGLAELRGGRWQFRNVHWSVPVPGPKTP